MTNDEHPKELVSHREATTLLEEFLCEYQNILLTRGINASEAVCKQNELIDEYAERIEQAIAATLGRPKAKSHPYGYEPDTGAFDCTRCKCGCINDISATYCNDCGGEIEVDMNAEKELYHHPRNSVFAEKHDDGSLEFGGKRYIAATLGNGTLTAEQVREAIEKRFDFDVWVPNERWQAIADELNATMVKVVER